MRQINNVFVWSLLEKQLFYTDDVNNLFCIDALNNEASEKYNLSYEPSYFYQLPDERFIIVDHVNKPSSIYSASKLEPFNMDEAGRIAIQEQDARYLVLYKGHLDEKVYRIFDWVKNKVTAEAKTPFTIVKDKALSFNEGVLNCYNLQGELSWQYKPGAADPQLDKDEPAKMIGLYKNELWIQPNSNSFMVLDVLTGKPVIPVFNVKEELGLTSFSIGNAYLDEHAGKIRIIAYSYYLEVDLATHKALLRKKQEGGWRIENSRFYAGDPRVYFTGNNTFSATSMGNIMAGIFNTETLEIEWHYSLPDDDKYHFFVDAPQANEKHIAVKDSNKTLYLFER
ncbi:hypothetical protein [Longitalea luteola]|uniref:hypothetical protein n=1 Tax=Longitalea luteola TaxID=2812563 RepID=UPI001A96C55E|nr:hypothetical protein [Longitalea luteola]